MRFLLILIVLACCNSNKKKQATNNYSGLGQFNQDIHRISKSPNFFSSLTEKDTFLLELNGKFLTKSKIRFKLISYKGEVILDEEFEMMDLYGWGPDVTKPNPDSLSIEKHLLKRFDSFFDVKHFYLPAINREEKYDTLRNSVIAEKDWEDIKKSPESIGFGFTLGEESISYIVYSRKEKKAILYKTCC